MKKVHKYSNIRAIEEPSFQNYWTFLQHHKQQISRSDQRHAERSMTLRTQINYIS